MADDVRSTARISKEKSHLYDKLVKEESSPFYGKDKTLVFITAAALGFNEKKKSSLTGDRQDLFVVNLLKDKEQLWIMKSIAISADGVDVLKELKKVTQICEEYANEGIHILMDIYNSEVDPSRRLAEMMTDSKSS